MNPRKPHKQVNHIDRLDHAEFGWNFVFFQEKELAGPIRRKTEGHSSKYREGIHAPKSIIPALTAIRFAYVLGMSNSSPAYIAS